MAQARGVVRLIVTSPDGRRVLARPNGLAGWALPAVPATVPFSGWDASVGAAAGRVVGAAVEPIGEVEPGCWAVRVTGRVPSHGRTWVGLDELDRLGADAPAVRRWRGLGSDR